MGEKKKLHAVFAEWRLACALKRPMLLRRVATAANQAAEWQLSGTFRRAALRALMVWHRYLMRVTYARRVQIAELERDELLRQLTRIQDDRSRSNRQAFSTIERSMSAALLARA